MFDALQVSIQRIRDRPGTHVGGVLLLLGECLALLFVWTLITAVGPFDWWWVGVGRPLDAELVGQTFYGGLLSVLLLGLARGPLVAGAAVVLAAAAGPAPPDDIAAGERFPTADIRQHVRSMAVAETSAGVWAIPVVFVTVPVVLAAMLTADTAIGLLRYALDPTLRLGGAPSELAIAAVLLAPFLLTYASLSFTGPLARLDDIDPRRAPVASLRLAVRHPLATLGIATGYGAVVGIVLGGLQLLGAVIPDGLGHQLSWGSPLAIPAIVALFALLVLLFQFFLRALVAVQTHVVVERADTADPRLGSSPLPSRETFLRVAFVAVLVLGLLTGTAWIRVTDTRPYGVDERPVADSADASAVIAGAYDRLEHTSHQMNVSMTVHQDPELDTDEREAPTVNWTVQFDFRDWQYAKDDHWDTYTSESVRATTSLVEHPVRPTPRFAFYNRQTGNWSAKTVPTGNLHDGLNREVLRDADLRPGPAWSVADRTAEHVVLVKRGPAAVDEQHWRVKTVYDNSTVHAVVDRETGRPVRIEAQVRYYRDVGGKERDGLVAQDIVIRFDQYERVDVQRPPALGRRNLPEYLWDLTLY